MNVDIEATPIGRDIAGFGDGVAVDGDTAGYTRRAGAIADLAVAQDDGKVGLAGAGDEKERGGEHEERAEHSITLH
jgi:hypothetical protein